MNATRASLPAFALYGEAGAPAPPLLHIESIVARSRLHDWEIDAHVHQGLHQVLWLRSGRVQAMLDESRIEAAGPLLLAIPPGTAHAFRFTPGTQGHVLTVNAGLLAEGESALGQALAALFSGPRHLALDESAPEVPRLHALFEALQAEAEADDTAGGDSGEPRWLAQVEAHYREHWPVTRHAERLGLSTERLNRLVRAETGHNAQALLHQRLTREATRRLVHVAMPVSQLAFELGFEDPAYFCRFFKRQTGLSPRAYREQAGRITSAGRALSRLDGA